MYAYIYIYMYIYIYICIRADFVKAGEWLVAQAYDADAVDDLIDTLREAKALFRGALSTFVKKTGEATGYAGQLPTVELKAYLSMMGYLDEEVALVLERLDPTDSGLCTEEQFMLKGSFLLDGFESLMSDDGSVHSAMYVRVQNVRVCVFVCVHTRVRVHEYVREGERALTIRIESELTTLSIHKKRFCLHPKHTHRINRLESRQSERVLVSSYDEMQGVTTSRPATEGDRATLDTTLGKVYVAVVSATDLTVSDRSILVAASLSLRTERLGADAQNRNRDVTMEEGELCTQFVQNTGMTSGGTYEFHEDMVFDLGCNAHTTITCKQGAEMGVSNDVVLVVKLQMKVVGGRKEIGEVRVNLSKGDVRTALDDARHYDMPFRLGSTTNNFYGRSQQQGMPATDLVQAADYSGTMRLVISSAPSSSNGGAFNLLPVECPMQCGATYLKPFIPLHSALICPLSLVPCHYKHVGCSQLVQRRHVQHHAQNACAFRGAGAGLQDLLEQVQALQHHAAQLEGTLHSLPSQLDREREATAQQDLLLMPPQLVSQARAAVEGKEWARLSWQQKLNHCKDCLHTKGGKLVANAPNSAPLQTSPSHTATRTQTNTATNTSTLSPPLFRQLPATVAEASSLSDKTEDEDGEQITHTSTQTTTHTTVHTAAHQENVESGRAGQMAATEITQLVCTATLKHAGGVTLAICAVHETCSRTVLLATASESDSAVRFWMLSNEGQDAQHLHTAATQPAPPVALYSSQMIGGKVFSGGSLNVIHVYDTDTVRDSILRSEGSWSHPPLQPVTQLGQPAHVEVHAMMAVDNTKFLSADDCGVVYKWDIETSKEELKLQEHNLGVRALARIDTNTFASGSIDTSILIWDLRAQRDSAGVLIGQCDAVTQMCMIDGAESLLVSAGDCTLKVWDIRMMRLLRDLDGCAPMVKLVTNTSHTIVTSFPDSPQSLRLWSTPNFAKPRDIDAHTGPIKALDSIDSCLFSIANDRCLKLWHSA